MKRAATLLGLGLALALPASAFAAPGRYAGAKLEPQAPGSSLLANGSFEAGPPPPPPPVPAPPASRFHATTIDHAHIELTWAPVAAAARYRILRGTLLIGETSGLSFTDTLLWPQSRYDYRLEALSETGALLQFQEVSAQTALLPAAGFPRPFPATSVWNQPVGETTPQPNSSALSAHLVANARNPNLTLHSYAVSVAEAHPSDPTFSVPCTRYGRCTLGAFGSFSIPMTAQADPSADGHLAVYDPRTQREWDLWQGSFGSAWSASAGAAVSMQGDGTAPQHTASGNAANFPLLGGLIRPEELLQGEIAHALVFMMPHVSTLGHVCPATHHAGDVADPNALMEGMRIQLDPALNVEALPLAGWQKTIARALQRYGAYLRDGSGSLAILAENPRSRGYDAWANVGLAGNSVSLAALPWNRVRVLQPPATGC